MLGLHRLQQRGAAVAHIGFWPALLLAPLACGLLGALTEMLLLRRIYKAPELFQLLATFALVLVIKDAALWLWGPEELFGPRAPGLEGSVEILGRQFPTYDLLLIASARWCWALTLLLTAPAWARWCAPPRRTAKWWAPWASTRPGCSPRVRPGHAAGRPGRRAAAAARARQPGDGHAHHWRRLRGGGGGRHGQHTRRLHCRAAGGRAQGLCIWLGVQEIGAWLSFSKLTLVVEFLVMAVVLVWRPWGLLGKPQALARARASRSTARAAARRPPAWLALLAALVLLPLAAGPALCHRAAGRHLVAALFAASLHFIMGPAACTPSVMRPTLAWVPTARRCWCARWICPWKPRCCWRRWWPRWRCSMAGSACGCRACT
jgi:branched-chain amino acid transport system permease protein